MCHHPSRSDCPKHKQYLRKLEKAKERRASGRVHKRRNKRRVKLGLRSLRRR